MAQAGNQDLTERFTQFYRNYYRDEIGTLAQKYPNEQRSLYIDYDELYQFDRDLAEDFQSQPDQMREYAEEALRLYDLPADVSLGQAHVRLENLPEHTDIRGIRVHDNHIGKLVSVQGIVRKATDVRPKVTEAAFECQRCGTMTYIPQADGGFQEPHECQGCERQGPFNVNFDQSEFIDSQKLRIQESPEGLRGGETPQSIDVDIEDDITGHVTAGDHVTVTGVLHIEQVTQGNEKSAIFDLYMDGVSVRQEDEEFENMDITQEDVEEIIELSNRPTLYEDMVASLAPAIYGYEEEKLAMILQLFSGVTKHLPDGSRIRGDLHMLLIGDPGTGKCVSGDTRVSLADGSEIEIRELVERNLDDPNPIEDGVWDEVNFEVPALQQDGSIAASRAVKVWKREAPKTMYRVTTASGRKLDVTPSHPLFVQREGRFTPVAAKELDAGEFIATPRRLEVEADDTLHESYRTAQSYNAVRLDLPSEWTPDLARLLGYIVAEGYVEQRDDYSGFVSITNNDDAVLADSREILESLGLETTTREPHDGKEAVELICSAGEFVSFLRNLEEELLSGSADQRVPRDLFGTSRPITAAFIKGFIEGEGHVSASQREITAASTSQLLLEDVQSLLLQQGIQSQHHERKNGSYRLRISGSEFDKYVTQIGFITDRKQNAAEDHLETDRNTNLDVIPDIGRELRRIRETLGLTQSECGIPRGTYRHYEAGDRNPSVGSLRRVIETFEAELATSTSNEVTDVGVRSDGGSVLSDVASLRRYLDGDVRWDRIESIEPVEPADEWVYDLEVEGTHNYVSNGVISHNSQMISYVENIAPRSVYTSGKGSSAAGLTAAAVRDDFGDGQQWSLEAGALVLADKGIAAVDELDKMDSADRSAMHEGLEQQQISVSKAGINATLKSRCSLLGAANPKYGRFDQYEPIGEQIDLEPALISRFDLIFTVTDQPDPDHDAKLADHIIKTNYAGELNTHREEVPTSEFTPEEIEDVTEEVAPEIEADLLRKYIAYSKRNCFPTMTDEAKQVIRDFYVDLRAKGADEDAPVPVTARKLEALVRLSEASARVRLSDTVEREDAERVTDIVESCLRDIGVDPETGQFDADVVETGTSKTQRDRIKNIKGLIAEIEQEYEEGAPVEEVLDRADEIGMDPGKAEEEIEKLRRKGEVYEPQQNHLRTT